MQRRVKAYSSSFREAACFLVIDDENSSVSQWITREEAMGLAEAICSHLTPADAQIVADAILFDSRQRMGEGK